MKKQAWQYFSQYIRLKYADKKGMVQCYTCGVKKNWYGDGMQAGHLTPGRNNAVLLDEEQVRPQCYRCNCCFSGEQYKFGKKLEQELGADKVKEIMNRRHHIKKITPKMWKDFRDHYKKECHRIAREKGLPF